MYPPRSALTLALLAACAIGAPPGWSDAKEWTFPLVPIADGRLVVPVYVHGHGPYLFAIDPDADITVVDGLIINQSEQVYTPRQGVRLVDSTDTSHATFYSQLTDWKIGDLAISMVRVAVVQHPLDAGGRSIDGILGHDVIVDSLVFSIDRDRGVVVLTTHDKFAPPTDAIAFDYEKQGYTWKRPWNIPRRLVPAKIDGVDFAAHVDFGRAQSRVVPYAWDKAKLAPREERVEMWDEAGTRRLFDRVGVAHEVTVAGQTQHDFAFAPFQDERYFPNELLVALGLDFFTPFHVDADWHHSRIYLRPRSDDARARQLRLARWGEPIANCPHPGCVQLVLDDTHVTITPDSMPIPIEVIVRATTPSGAHLPDLEINLPARAQPITNALDDTYRGATLDVVDASPFPRHCANDAGCVVPMAALPLPP